LGRRLTLQTSDEADDLGLQLRQRRART